VHFSTVQLDCSVEAGHPSLEGQKASGSYADHDKGDNYMFGLHLGITFRRIRESLSGSFKFCEALGLVVEIFRFQAMNYQSASDQITIYIHHEKNNRLAPVLPFGTNNLW
jgi:hypothetical protein